MSKPARVVRLMGGILVGIAAVLLAVNLFIDPTLNIALPLVFLMLGGGFFILVNVFTPRWPEAVYLYIPACLLLAFGVIFLLNVVTRDWNAWAYAWLLLVAGLGAGLLLTARARAWDTRIGLGALGLMVGGLTFFAIFGAIAGGLFIAVMAPLLLAAGGALLFWVKPETLLPAGVFRRLKPSSPLETGLPGAAPLPRPVPTALVEPLSAREREVLGWIEAGLSNQQIAEKLTVAPSTVKTHINNIYAKLEVQTRAQAIKKARELGLLP